MVKKVIGLMVVITGILLMLSNLGVMSIDNLSDVIFPLGIMIIGITGLIEKRHFDFVLLLFIIFGALYSLASVNVIEMETANSLFGPTILIVIGLSLIFGVSKRISDKPVTSYVALFSGVEDKNISSEYVSSEVTAIFGGADIDYRKIKIKGNQAYINATAIFGGVTVMVPEDVKVIVKGVPIFGGAENKAKLNEEAKKELVINYTAIFGGVEIKN